MSKVINAQYITIAANPRNNNPFILSNVQRPHESRTQITRLGKSSTDQTLLTFINSMATTVYNKLDSATSHPQTTPAQETNISSILVSV